MKKQALIFISVIIFLLIFCGTCAAANNTTSNVTWSTPKKIDIHNFMDSCVDNNGTVHTVSTDAIPINDSDGYTIGYNYSISYINSNSTSSKRIATANYGSSYDYLADPRINYANKTLYITYVKAKWGIGESPCLDNATLMCYYRAINSTIWSTKTIASLGNEWDYRSTGEEQGKFYFCYDYLFDKQGTMNLVYRSLYPYWDNEGIYHNNETIYYKKRNIILASNIRTYKCI